MRITAPHHPTALGRGANDGGRVPGGGGEGYLTAVGGHPQLVWHRLTVHVGGGGG